MKKYGRLALAALLLVATLALASCGSSAGSGGGSGSDGGMQSMDHEEMNGGGESGSGMKDMNHGDMKGMGGSGMASGMVMENGEYSDEAFLDAMVPHHQGAVEMAEVALDNAEHGEIRRLARNIISTQRAEIENLRSIKEREFGTSDVPMRMGSEDMESMGMMTDPRMLADERPFDRAFIDAMIPHHQSAIEMARVTSEKSDNPDIQTLAGNIVDAQEREIGQMKSWREEWYPEG